MIELLVVIAILSTLIALVMAAVGMVRESAAKREAVSQIQRLHTAFTQYLLEKPVPTHEASGHLYYGDVVNASGETVSSALKWMREIETYSFSGAAALDGSGFLLDPWEQRYCMVIGSAGDPSGNKAPELVIADGDITDWIPVNRNAEADSRIYLYSYGPDNPGGKEVERWIYNAMQ